MTKTYRPDTPPNQANPGQAAGLLVTRLCDLSPSRTPWLWRPVLALGMNVLAGDPGVSKSILTVDWAARVTIGRPLLPPGRGGGARPASVVLLCDEDDPQAVVKPRFLAAGGDLARAYLVQGVRAGGGGQAGDSGGGCSPLRLREDAGRVAALMDEVGDVRLVVLDPLNNYLSAGDTGGDAAVRDALRVLLAAARRHKAAVVAVTHLNKGRGLKALHRVLNSVGLVGVSRMVWLAAGDPGGGGPGVRVLAPVKVNAAQRPPGIAYRIEEKGQGRGRARQPVLEYDRFDLDLTADEVLAAGQGASGRGAGEPDPVDIAARWLAEVFSSRTAIPSEGLKKMAEAAGVTWRTLERAKQAAGVRSVKEGKTWLWTTEPPEARPHGPLPATPPGCKAPAPSAGPAFGGRLAAAGWNGNGDGHRTHDGTNGSCQEGNGYGATGNGRLH